MEKINIFFYENQPREDGYQRNQVIFGGYLHAAWDRSPCGTGTSAMIAVMHEKKQLELDQPWYTKCALGHKWVAKAVRETKFQGRDAVIPQITADAYIVSFNKLVIDQDDPLRHGWSPIHPHLLELIDKAD